VGEIAFAFCFCFHPLAVQVLLQPTECFFFRDAGIGNTVVMVFEQVPFFLGCQVAVVRNALVMAVSYQVHYVFLQVSTSTTNDLHFVLADHFGQADAQFAGTHGACQGDHHFAPFQQVGFISFGCIYKGSGIEVSIVMGDKLADWSFAHNSIVFWSGKNS
jgi:hypothetical protein